MQSYSDSMSTNGSVQKSGATQPRPTGGGGRNPDQGTGAIQSVGVGADSPVVVKTGATNNGLSRPESWVNQGERGGRRLQGEFGPNDQARSQSGDASVKTSG